MPYILPNPHANPERLTIIDEQNANLTYIGRAKLGTATSDAKWQILRIQKLGSETKIQYVNGSRRYNQVWDNHLILVYAN